MFCIYGKLENNVAKNSHAYAILVVTVVAFHSGDTNSNHLKSYRTKIRNKRSWLKKPFIVRTVLDQFWSKWKQDSNVQPLDWESNTLTTVLTKTDNYEIRGYSHYLDSFKLKTFGQ